MFGLARRQVVRLPSEGCIPFRFYNATTTESRPRNAAINSAGAALTVTMVSMLSDRRVDTDLPEFRVVDAKDDLLRRVHHGSLDVVSRPCGW